MDKIEIKAELLKINRKLKQMSGTFDSFVIIHDYIEFLKSEPFTKKLMKPLADKLGVEANKLEKLAIHIPLPVYDSIEGFPFFKDQLSYFNQKELGSLGPDLSIGLSANLALLSQIYILIEDIKDYQKNGDLIKANEVIEYIKRISLSTPQNILIKGVDTSNISMSKRLDISMELLNKYIIDEIDSQLLLEKNKVNKLIYYDDINYYLHIREHSIRIQFKNIPPVEHHILKTIFAEDDITRKVYFYEISESEGDEYANNWGRYRSACVKLQGKISKQSNYAINDFIIHKTGVDGWCKINQKHV